MGRPRRPGVHPLLESEPSPDHSSDLRNTRQRRRRTRPGSRRRIETESLDGAQKCKPLVAGLGSEDDEPKARQRQSKDQPSPQKTDPAARKTKQIDPEKAWDEHFAEHKESPVAIRAALEVLVRSKKFDHASALLKAALRNGISEPWMYEALAIVQVANNEDKEEIKRTLLSAADVLADSPDAQYRVARALARHGLKETAIRLYRDIADKAPDAPQPYAESLDLAAETHDVWTVTWAATRILSQAWIGVHEELHKKARSRTAEVERWLRAEGRAKEADDLVELVRQADSRDLVIRITWQGDADIDLKVLEPLGTVCSAQNRMTPAGGVLVQDSFGKDPGSSKNPAELYVCSRGLPGDYEIRLERVWGNPQGGRVKVEVVYSEGTPNEKREAHYVAVTSTKPLVVKLESGRRTQLLAIPQFVTPPVSSEHAKTPYQQLIAYTNSQSQQNGYTGPQQLHQFGRGGVVAFNPTVQQFFFGAGLGVQAVVSADRRYVRLSMVPSFTQLSGEKRFTVTGAAGGGGLGGF